LGGYYGEVGMNKMTLLEALGMACIKGDLAAAYALRDLLTEMEENPPDKAAEAVKALRRRNAYAESYAVFRWPEFQAFIKRAGVNVQYPIRTINISLPLDGAMEIEIEQLGMDAGSIGPAAEEKT
jgi:hypothetical protein